MKIGNRFLGNISVRSLCIAILMIGAFLVVHGFLNRLAKGSYFWECLLGIVVSAIAIGIAAIPSKKSDFHPIENALEEEQE